MKDLGLAERYRPLHEIGSGGGGEVYAVHDNHLGKDLALKIYKPDQHRPADDLSFFREFLLVLRLFNPNLVRVYDFGYTKSNHPFYTMDLLDQAGIEDIIRADDPQNTMKICADIASAVASLHFFDLVHNDLKPENIKFIRENDEIRIKLLDLGLTRDFSPDKVDSSLAGTVEFMAPELFDKNPPSQRSDLYSLGVIFYSFLTGSLPFLYDDPLLVISQKMENDVPQIDRAESIYPQEFIQLTENLLARKAEYRPQSGYAVACELAQLGRTKLESPDFADLLKSAIGIRIARLFELNQYHKSDQGIFYFHDSAVLEIFSKFLKAYLQADYHNVVENGDENITDVSPGAEQNSVINTIKIRPGESYEPDEEKISSGDNLKFNLVLLPSYGPCNIAQDKIIAFDSAAQLENWFDQEITNQEYVEKIDDLCSDSIESLADICNDLQARGIIRFKGDLWEIDSSRFVSYNIFSQVHKQALERIAYLSHEDFKLLSRLAVMRYAFERPLARRLLQNIQPDINSFMERMTSHGILAFDDKYYRFKSAILRVALVLNLDPEERKKAHLKAAEIIRSSGGIPAEQKILALAQNFINAEQPDPAVKWTLKAVKHLIARDKYRVALTMLENCLELVYNTEIEERKPETISHLLAARGEVENLLGLANKSLSTFARIIRLQKSHDNRELIARAYKYIGDIYKANSKSQRGLRALEKALAIFKDLDNQIEISHTYNNIGNIYWVAAEMDKALECYQKALDIQEKENLLKDVASTLNNMGSCYIFKNRLDKTIEYYKRSIRIKEEINDRPELARTYNNLGAVYLELGQVNEALKYLHDALRINREIDSTREILHNLENITFCELTRGQFERADSFANEGLKIAHDINDIPFQVSMLTGQAIAAVEVADLGRADCLISQANHMASGLSDQSVRFLIYRALATMYLTMYAREPFREWVLRAREVAEKLGDDRGLANIDTLSCYGSLRFDQTTEQAEKYFEQAMQRIPDIDSNRLSLHMHLNRMMISLRKSEVYSDEPDNFAQMLSDPCCQLMMAEYKYLCAAQKMLENDHESALEDLFEASRIAEKLGQKDLLWRIKHSQGLAEKKILNYEEAYLNFKRAVSIIKQIAATIDDPVYLKSFLTQPEALSLKQDIIELAGRMGQK